MEECRHHGGERERPKRASLLHIWQSNHTNHVPTIAPSLSSFSRPLSLFFLSEEKDHPGHFCVCIFASVLGIYDVRTFILPAKLDGVHTYQRKMEPVCVCVCEECERIDNFRREGFTFGLTEEKECCKLSLFLNLSLSISILLSSLTSQTPSFLLNNSATQREVHRRHPCHCHSVLWRVRAHAFM